MKVLIACEFSGVVREAFRRYGHDAVSCDFEPTELPGPHYQGDVLGILPYGWDLMVAFPPCTYLAVAGARWFAEDGERFYKAMDALDFVRKLMRAPIDKIAIENPKSIISSQICKPSQTIQPYQFGEPYRKLICLWLKNLPMLRPTNIVNERNPAVHYHGPSKNRARERSITYKGIAEAMASQWS